MSRHLPPSLTYLAFQGRLQRTICAFTDESAMTDFVRRVPEDIFDRLPTVDPKKRPLLTFHSAEHALVHFGLLMRTL